MATGTLPMTRKQVRTEIATIHRASEKIRSSKQTAQNFLVKAGFVTKGGKVTARYGG